MNWSKYVETHPYRSDEMVKEYANNLGGLFKTCIGWSGKRRMGSVLEIGAGHGINTMVLDQCMSPSTQGVEHNGMFTSVVASEPNEVLFKHLVHVTRESSRVSTLNMNAKETANQFIQSGKQFNFVVCFNVFLFLSNKAKILRKFASILKPGGYVVIIEPIKLMDYTSRVYLKTMATTHAIFGSKKFSVVFHGTIGVRGQFCSLLQLN